MLVKSEKYGWLNPKNYKSTIKWRNNNNEQKWSWKNERLNRIFKKERKRIKQLIEYN